MEIFLNIIKLLIGFVALVKGADLLISGGSHLARRFGVSSLIVGLTVLAFGTSLPELVVNIISSSSGNSGMALGNVLGSNIANIGLAVGLTSIFFVLPAQKNLARRELPFLVILSLALCVMLLGEGSHVLGRTDGVILLMFFLLFMYMIIMWNKKDIPEEKSKSKEKIWIMILKIIIGLIGLIWGGDMVVNGASEIGRMFGMSEVMIGLTIVALGTSLPEVVTSFVAAKKGETDMAIGNIIGSNIFNIALVLGMSATITPISFSTENTVDLLVMLGFTVLLFLLVYLKNRISRSAGIMLFAGYISYILFVIWRG